jgi:diguanylate cyclase (GGDEF)-like protein
LYKSIGINIIIFALFLLLAIGECFHIPYASLILIFTLFLLFIFSLYKIKEKEKNFLQEKLFDKKQLEAFESTGIYAKLDLNYNIQKANRNFCQSVHMVKADCEKSNIFTFIPEQEQEIKETLKYKQIWEGLVVLKTNDKASLYLNCTFTPILDEKENIQECIFVATDMTDFVISRSNIKKSLYTDSLTKLPNRLKLFTDTKNLHREYETTYILFNIDSFESINNLYGHDFGDEILLQFAHWLLDNMPNNQQTNLYKLEADIYLCVITNPFLPQYLNSYLETLSKKISQTIFTCNGIDIDITVTIGAAQAKQNQLKLAQISYKEAKIAKKSFCIYDKKSNKEQEYNKNIQVLKDLKEAVQEGRILPYFQPIVDAKSLRIKKYESLMRVKKTNGDIMMPAEFLSIAKNSKIYHEISQMLIEKTFETFKNKRFQFSINLSYLDITDQKTTQFLLNKLKNSGLGPWVVFELLESEGIKNYKSVINFIDQVKAYGSKIAIDDFGSGYSNFERLLELKIDYIKIDGSLIKNIDTNEDTRIITKTIVNFAKELGIQTVAEYVHSKEILQVVQKLGIDFAQGFYLGKPSDKLAT